MPEYHITDRKTGKQEILNAKSAWGKTKTAIKKADSSEQRSRILGDYLNGIKGDVTMDHVRDAYKGRFASEYRSSYSPEERKRETGTPGTRLWMKEANARSLEKAEGSRRRKIRSRGLETAQQLGINTFSSGFRQLAVFMTGDEENDVKLAGRYYGGKRKTAIVSCIKQFMRVDTDSLDLSSDEAIAENAGALEYLNEMVGAIHFLLSASTDIYAELDERSRIEFEKKYGKANVIVTWYRLKKQVMTDSYYRSHEDREIGISKDVKGTAEEKNLTEMIWQSEGGLMLFANKADKYVFRGTVKEMSQALLRKGTGSDRLLLQKRLRQRRVELEKRGIASRMDDFIWRERHIDTKGKLGILGHARNLKFLGLNGDPEADLKLLPELMDQREILEKSAKMRRDSASSYYIEQSDRQVELADLAISAKWVLSRLEEDLLIIGGLTKGGGVDPSHTAEEITRHRKSYKIHLKEYRKKMEAMEALSNKKFELPQEEDPKDAKYIGPGKTKDFEAEAEELINSLTQVKYNDKAIYDNRYRIFALLGKCKDKGSVNVLTALSERAEHLWKKRRLLNVKRALRDDKKNDELKALKKSLTESTSGEDKTLEAMIKLRAEAEKKQYDFADLKAEARHYSDQFSWAQNAENSGSYTNVFIRAFFRFFSFVHGGRRSIDHGEARYNEAVNRMQNIPEQIRSADNEGPVLFQRGTEEVPPVDISRMFGDSTKSALRTLYDQTALLVSKPEYGAGLDARGVRYLRRALEAMKNYTEIRYVVTTESTEMEMAFIDRFKKDVHRAFQCMKKVSFEDPVILNVMKMLDQIETTGRGKLRGKMTDAEYEAAMEQKPVYTEYDSGDTAANNVADIPLFLHKPHLNDIKQGYVGDCYFHSALEAFIHSNPDRIMDMFYDVGDGTVLVKFFMGFDKNNRRVDSYQSLIDKDTTLKPVYVRVRKDYDPGGGVAGDCMWVQLMEKAFAATGAAHGISKVDESGKIRDMVGELSGGDPEKILIHLTGRKDVWYLDKDTYSEPTNEDGEDTERMRTALNGLPLWTHEKIWEKMKENTGEFGQGTEEKDSFEKILDAAKAAADILNEESMSMLEQFRIETVDRAKLISPGDFAEIEKKYRQMFIIDGEVIKEQVRLNLSGQLEDKDSGTDIYSPAEVMGHLIDWCQEGMSRDEMLEKLELKKEYYSPPKLQSGETQANMDARLTYQKFNSKIRNKAMTETNPGNRYTIREMAFLHDARAAAGRSEAITYTVWGHAMAVMDVKLHNGKWFLLVRDTCNTRNYVYRSGQDGELERIPRSTSCAGKEEIRRLDGTMRSAFSGISWWELKDVYREMHGYGASPKVS